MVSFECLTHNVSRALRARARTCVVARVTVSASCAPWRSMQPESKLVLINWKSQKWGPEASKAVCNLRHDFGSKRGGHENPWLRKRICARLERVHRVEVVCGRAKDDEGRLAGATLDARHRAGEQPQRARPVVGLAEAPKLGPTSGHGWLCQGAGGGARREARA